ncbi:tetratricopeptide repeat protein [Lunatimonas salinarum]|uniref:tetratricopeptide repeat protein n=1 Tax=Lunatimonas salinarum TaxID=1774590 RepID=UPI001ADFBE38|nr:tetratricopeptide repeat protein [Lunatimonas salinarum]
MANLNRIEQLLRFVKEDPSDPFNFYALALEYQNDHKKQAKEYFKLLLDQFPEYLPTYFHAAMFFTELGELEQAAQIYKKGISLAQNQQNHHAERELKSAYLNFQLEHED